MFGPSYDDLRGVSESHCTQVLALMLALIEKGVITAEDVERHRVLAASTVEQIFEQRIRENNKRQLEENPGIAIFAKLCGEEIPLPQEKT